MASRHLGTTPGQQAAIAHLLAAETVLASLDVASWVEVTHQAQEVPSLVDIVKRDGFIADLSRRLTC